MSIVLHGIAVGGGIAIGRALLLQQGLDNIPHYAIEASEVKEECLRFQTAVKLTRRQLEQLRNTIPENAPTELGAFISLHLMLLTDVTLSREPIDIIEEKEINAEWALQVQLERLSQQFDVIEDEYLRERKQDMLQVGERIFKNLRGHEIELNVNSDLFDDTILIAHDISPADTIFFKDNRVAAFVTDVGGPTSHTAILARSLDIPSVIALHNARQIIQDDEWIIVDGIDGVLIIDPDEKILAEYRKRAKIYRNQKRQLNKLKNTAATTADDVNIQIFANIESPNDITSAHKFSIDGVGLFRSEFLYLNRDTLPTEDEQYEIYLDAVKRMKGKPLTLRTVDLGVDKNPRWFSHGDALNPALGLTGIRLCLAEPIMFRTQMRAVLRAAVHGPIRMLWPMIGSLSELRQCHAHLELAKQQLSDRGETFQQDIPVGCMIEVPSAALMVTSLLRQVDFLSIGTNDLIQYTLAVDRSDDAVSYLYQPAHPAVLKLLTHILRSAIKAGKPVSVCGEMAGDDRYTRLLLGMGLRQFSMHPSNILRVKNMIVHSNTDEVEKQVWRILRNDDPNKVDDLLKKLNQLETQKTAA